LPSGVAANSLFAFSDTGLTAVDHSMNIYTSFDSGTTWKKFDKAALPLPLDTTYWEADPKNRFNFYTTINGLYIFPVEVKPEQIRLVYMDYRTATHRQFNLPEPVENISRIFETNTGVYFWPRSSGLSSAKIYFLPKGKDTFESRELPQFLCQEIGYPDNSGNRLQLNCQVPFGTKKYWESKDGGLKWAEIQEANSLFKK